MKGTQETIENILQAFRDGKVVTLKPAIHRSDFEKIEVCFRTWLPIVLAAAKYYDVRVSELPDEEAYAALVDALKQSCLV